MLNSSTGERIKKLRETMKMTQKEFGERLGVGRDVISNIELERVSIKDHVIKLISNTYYANEEWLLEGTGEMFSTEDDLLKVIANNLGEMDEIEKKFLIEYFQLPTEHRKIFINFLTNIAKE